MQMDNIEKKCNHNPNDKNNTLIMINKRVMVYPQRYDFFCNKRNEFFSFKKNDENIYYLED